MKVFHPAIKVPAGVAAALSYSLDFLNFEEKTDIVGRADFDPLFTFWEKGDEISESPPAGFNINEWRWKVLLRPKYFLRRMAYDKYDMNGYAGRHVQDIDARQENINARRLYYFVHQSGTGAGTGGGVGGGAGGGQGGSG